MGFKKQFEQAGKKLKESAYQQLVNRFVTTGQYEGMTDAEFIHMLKNPETAKVYREYGQRKAQGGGVTQEEIETLTNPSFYTPESYDQFDKDTVRQAIIDQTAFTDMHRNEGYWDVETNDPSWWSDEYLAEQLAGYDDQIWKEKTIEELINSSTGYGWKYSNMTWPDLLDEMMGDEELTSPYVEDWIRAYNLMAPAEGRVTWEDLQAIEDPNVRNYLYNDLQKRFSENIDTLLTSGMSRVTEPGQATASETLTIRKERALKEQANRQTMQQFEALLNDPQYSNTMALATGSGPVTVEGETYSSLFLWAQATGNGGMLAEYEEKGYGFMTPEELVTYQRLYEINQGDAARYLEALSRELLYRRSLFRSTEKSLKATDGFFNGALSWAEALATPVENILTGDILQQTYHVWKGDADPNAHYFDALNDQTTIRTAQSDEIAKKYGGVASFFYEAFNSVADVALTTGLDIAAGGTGLVNAGLNATKAYSGRLQSNAARDVQGLWSLGQAIGDAGIEALFERLGFDGSAKSGNAIWNFLKNALGEGAEEFFSNAGTTAFDELLSYARGGDSELMEQYKAYVLAGEENPGMKVAISKAGEMAKDFVMGGIAGGALGGVSSGVDYTNTRAMGKAVAKNADVNALLDIAEAMPEGSESRRLGKKYRAMLAHEEAPVPTMGDAASDTRTAESTHQTEAEPEAKAETKQPKSKSLPREAAPEATMGDAAVASASETREEEPEQKGQKVSREKAPVPTMGDAASDTRTAESTHQAEAEPEAKAETKQKNKKAGEKSNDVKKLSFYKLGRLTQALESDLHEEHSRVINDVMDSAIANRLMELGDDAETARQNAPIIRQVYRGQAVPLSGRGKIVWNKNASQVTRELASTLQESEQVKNSQAERDKTGAVGDVSTKSDESRVGKSWQTAMGVVAEKAQAPVRDLQAQLREALTNKKSPLNTAINEAKSKAAKVSKGGKNQTSKMVTVADGESGTEIKGEFLRFKKHGKNFDMIVATEGVEKTVSVEDMTQAEGAGMAEIIEYVAGGGTHDMSQAEANTLASVYQSVGGDASTTIRAYEAVYLSGYTGMDMPVSVLPDAAAQAVYDAAKTEAEADEKNRVARTSLARKAAKGTVSFLGKVKRDSEVTGAGSEEALSEAMEGMTESQKLTVEAVEEFSRQFKINTVLFESEGEGVSTMQNGSYDASTHTVYIDINSGANSEADIQKGKANGTLGYAIMRTMGHEVTHAIEATSAEGYKNYKTAVKAKLGKQWESLVQEKLRNAYGRGQKLTLQGAEAEVVADASEYMLQDSKFVETIDKSIRGRVKAVISDFVERVRGIFNKLAGGHRESRALRRMEGSVYHYLDNLQELWDVAAEEMVSRDGTGRHAGNVTDEESRPGKRVRGKHAGEYIGEVSELGMGKHAAADVAAETEPADETTVPRTEKNDSKQLPPQSMELALTDANLDSMTRNLPEGVQMSAREAQTETQQFERWFGNSQVVNEDGTPKVMYHGTRTDKNFTVFDTWGGNFGLFGVGSYFTDDKTVAEGYTRKGKGSKPRVYEVYLSIENPLDMDAAYDPAIWKTDDAYLNELFKGSQTNEEAFRRLKEYCADEEMERSEAEEFITDFIVSKGFDGIRHTGGGRYSKGDTNRHEVYIAFEPEQIKSATENVGTFDAQNPDIRYSTRLLNNEEYARLQSEWMNYQYRGYQYVQRNNGGIIVDFDNVLVYTDADGEPEYVLDVIDTDREINNDIIQTAMKLARKGVDHETQRIVLESMYGKGSARFRTRGKRKSTSGKKRAGAGRNAGGMGQGDHGQVPGQEEISQYSARDLPTDAISIREYSAREADAAYAEAVERGDSKTAQLLVNDAARRAGYIPVSRWHQTAADFTKFNTDNPVAGLNDSETPNGIFFKTNDHDIGIGGSKQMRVFLNHKNLLHFRNREEASAWYSENVPGYGDLNRELKAKLDEFEPEFKAIEDEQFDPDTTDERVEELFELEDQLIARMGKVETEYRARLREMLNDYFLRGNSQYDGIELDYDGHRWVNGVRENVHTFIVFKPNQVKSAEPVTYDDTGNVIPLSERFNAGNEDIRYSMRDATGGELVMTEKEITENREYVANMEPVIQLTGNMFAKNADKDFKTMAYDYLGDDGINAENPRLGMVNIGMDGIEHLIGSLTYRRSAMLPAVKSVIENGRIIQTEKNHKGYGYDTAVIASVVSLDAKDYYMGVAVRENADGSNGYYVHDAVMIEKRNSLPNKSGLVTAGEKAPTLAIILSDLANYNREFAETPNQQSARDLPTDAISIREYLGSMEPTDRMTDTERSLLERYQAHLKALGEKEAAIAEQEEIIRTAPLRNEDGTINAELQKAKNRIRLLREQAARETRALNAAESSKGFARLMATSRQVVDTYLLGANGSVADAADALDAEVDALTKRLRTLAEDITRTAEGQKAAFARGLYDQKQLNAAAKSLKDAYGSRMSVSAIADRLALCFGELYANPDSAEAAKQFVEDARDLAEDILRKHKYRYKSEILPLLKEKLGTISLTEIDLMEIRNAGLTLTEYKRMLSPYVTVAAGGSDLSSAVDGTLSYGDGTLSYGDGTLAAILGEDVEGNLAMRLYEVISNEKAKEAEIGTEGKSEGEMIIAVMADIAGTTLPVSEDGKTIEYLRKELQKHAGESVAAAQLVDEAIAGARKVTGRATRVWTEAARNHQTAKAAVEYYRKLEEQRRVTELREQKQDITEQLRSEYAKRLEEKVQKKRDELREREQKAREYRATRDEVNKLRRKIGRKVKRLNALRVRETDVKHVPQEFQHIADVVMQTFTDNALGRLAFSAEHMAALGRRYRILQELESDMSYYWDPEIAEEIENLQALGEAYTAIRERGEGVPSHLSLQGVELEVEILQGVDSVISNVLHMIDGANDAFIGGRTETFNEYAAKTGMELLQKKDYRQLRGGYGETQRALDEWLRTGNMTPVYFMEHLDSPMLQEIFDEVRKGQAKYARIVAEGKAFVQEAKERYHYGSWVADGKLTMKTSQGHTIELTREEAAELYAIAKRERTNKLYQTEHLIGGGFQFKDVLKKKGKGLQAAEKTTHQLDAADIARIENWLTDEQRAYADALVGFLSTTMADYGNEAAMAMFGYRKFTEAYYIPFKTAAEQRFLRGDEGPGGEDAGTGRVKNSGFTKKLQHKANATLVVGGITDTVTEHIHKMATYAALVEPIENMKRMLNYKMVDKDGTTNTIRALIGKKYGQASENYMTQLLKDLNGAAQGDERATKGINWLIGAFKRGAVMASASVVLQQPTAIARAMAYIPAKHFGQNPFYRPSKGTWDEMMKYSGTAVIKDMGKFDVGMGLTASQYMADEHLNAVEAYRRLKADSRWEAGKAGFKSFMDWLTAAPGVADQWTWGLIWKANKAYQAEQHPEMDHNSQAFLELCGSTFDNVIDHSQVYDSVLTRSDLMRSKNAIHKMATSFMAEPTMSINMLYDAVTGAWKKKYTRRHAGAIIGSVMASQVLAGAMAALVQAWNDNKDKRNWLEKYADAATGNILSNINPFGMIPYVSDFISLLQGYDVERADMTVLSTLITQTANFWGKVSKGEELTWKDWENFAGNWANLTGVPVKNIMREIRRTINAVGNTQWNAPDGFNVGQAMLENVPFYDSKNKTYYERIVAADLNGDTQLATDYREYMLLSKMVTEDALKTGLKSAMKEQVIAGKADAQTAIDYLVKIGAAEDADDAYWEVDKWEYMKETGNKADTYRKYDDFTAAVRTGENLKQVIQTYLDNGVDKATLAGQITSAFRAEYVSLYNSGKRSDASVLQSRLLTAYVALGYDRNRKLKDIQKWLEAED